MFSQVKNIFKLDNLNLSERLDVVETKFIVPICNLPDKQSFMSVIDSFPTRDKLTIIINDACGDNHQISKDNLNDLEKIINEAIKESNQDDELNIYIQIDKKNEDGRFSIYDFKSFCEDILKRDILEIMKWFSERLQNNQFLIFEVFDSEISLSTRTMAFVKCRGVDFSNPMDRLNKLKNCKENAFFYNMHGFELIPDDFIIEGVSNVNEEIKSLFDKIATILSMIYSVSSASIENEEINLQIDGQRSINKYIKINDVMNNEKWINLYDWIYTDGNIIDKKLIAQNVLSLFCKYDNFFSADMTMFEAIKTNYNLYLHKNVEQYLALKRDFSKFIQNIVSQISDYSLSISGKFKNNLIALLGFLFTVVLTRIGNVQKWNDIFTRDTLFILEIFLIGSIIYMIICLSETKYRLKKVEDGYENIKSNYTQILSDEEINEICQNDSFFGNEKKSVKRSMYIWAAIWSFLGLIGIIIIEFVTINHGILAWLWNKLF